MEDKPEAPFADESERKAWYVAHHWQLYSGVAAIVLVVLLGLTIFLGENAPLAVDAEWMEEIIENRHPVLEFLSLIMDFVGGGWFGVIVVPLGVVLALALSRHRWGALYFAIAAAASALTVQVLKNIFGRPRPDDILIVIDSAAFPSGHVANAATTAVALGIIFRFAWLWVAGVAYTVLMALSRTYLGAHWVTDTVGAVLVGVGVAVILWAPLAYRLSHERHQHEVGRRLYSSGNEHPHN